MRRAPQLSVREKETHPRNFLEMSPIFHPDKSGIHGLLSAKKARGLRRVRAEENTVIVFVCPKKDVLVGLHDSRVRRIHLILRKSGQEYVGIDRYS